MEMEAPEPLMMPSFLYGTCASVELKAYEEGLRCGAQYRQDGTFPEPREMREVASGELVIAESVIDFQHARPAWRPYLMSRLHEGLWEALDYPGSYEVDERYEDFCRQTAWSALYVALARAAPMSATRVALRLQSVLGFWKPLCSVQYLWRAPNGLMPLEALMGDAYGWAMEAWCPGEDISVEMRLKTAAERMARATRKDSLEAIFRQLPRVFALARNLKNPAVVGNPMLQHRLFTQLDSKAFERVSGAYTSEILGWLYDWDRQLGKN